MEPIGVEVAVAVDLPPERAFADLGEGQPPAQYLDRARVGV